MKECTDRARKAYLTSLMLTGFIVIALVFLLIDVQWFLTGTGNYTLSDPNTTPAMVYTKCGIFFAVFALAVVRLLTCATLGRYIATMAVFNKQSFYALLHSHRQYEAIDAARERRDRNDAFHKKVDDLLKR